MTKTHAYYDKLNMDAVKFSEACLIVRARIVEAAETMAFIQVSGTFPACLRAHWPEFVNDYGNEAARCFYHPDAKAISRAEEVFYEWFPLISDQSRPLLCTYAFRQALPKRFGSIGDFCKINAFSRSTFDRAIDKTIRFIAVEVLKKAQLLQCPSWKRVMTVMPNSRNKLDKMATVTFWRADDAKPRIQPLLKEVA